LHRISSLLANSLFPVPAIGHSDAFPGTTAMMEAIGVELVKRQVQFRIRDIYYPDPRDIITRLFSDSLLEGRVLDITDNGEGKRYAIVEVMGLKETVLIAVDRITRIV
jgi:hypothetical protein